MSPKKSKNSSKNIITLDTIEVIGSDGVTYSTSPDFSSAEYETIEKHTKATGGGLMVSICL